MNILAGGFCDFQESAIFQNIFQYMFWTNRLIQQIGKYKGKYLYPYAYDPLF